MERRARNRPAFTLIELLAVAPIVALALTFVAASAQRTAQQDRLAACLANLRAIGEASLNYAAEDANEIMIPVPALEALPDHAGTFEWGGKAGRGDRYVPGDVTTSRWGTRHWRGPAHRPLNTMIYKAAIADWNPVQGPANPGPGGINYRNDTQLDLDVYRCPADSGYAGGGFYYTANSQSDYYREPQFANEGLTAYDHYGNSFAANTFWSVSGLAGGSSVSWSPYLMPLSQIPAPSDSVAYQEIPSRFVWMWGSWDSSGCSNFANRVQGNYQTVPGWHGIDFGFNVGMADGAARTVIMRGTIRPAPNLGSSNYPEPFCGGTLTPYECHRCITLRGPGWQLDTLPAAPVLTPWFCCRSEADGERDSSHSESSRSTAHEP